MKNKNKKDKFSNVEKFKKLVFDTRQISTKETIKIEIEMLVKKGTEMGLDIDIVKAYIYFKYYVDYLGKIFETLTFTNGVMYEKEKK